MKSKVIVIVLLFTFSARGQTNRYFSFPDSNAVWFEEGSANFGGPTSWAHWQQQYYIAGDTTINFLYRKIYKKSLYETPPLVISCWSYNIPGVPYDVYYGALREDTILKRIYFLPSGWSTDTLLYDFDLIIGDTLPPSYNHSFEIIVTNVDSIFDGTNYRKSFELYGSSLSIIEGIGSTWGLFWSMDPPFESANTLQCFKENGTTLFSTTCPYACDLATNIGSVLKENSRAIIYPNPFHSSATIKVASEFYNAELKVYNLNGEIVNHQLIRQQNTLLSRNNMPSGVYYYVLSNSFGSIVRGKLLID